MVRLSVAKHGTQNFQKVPSITAHLFNLSLPNRVVYTAIILYTIKRVCRTLFVCWLSAMLMLFAFVCLSHLLMTEKKYPNFLRGINISGHGTRPFIAIGGRPLLCEFQYSTSGPWGVAPIVVGITSHVLIGVPTTLTYGATGTNLRQHTRKTETLLRGGTGLVAVPSGGTASVQHLRGRGRGGHGARGHLQIHHGEPGAGAMVPGMGPV